jgi:hypothetical protein
MLGDDPRLERRAPLVAQEIEDVEDTLRFDLDLSERLDLVPEEHELRRLLDRIEQRRWKEAQTA